MSRFRRVYVEISNICNLQCSFCPEVERDKRVMSAAMFRKVLTEVAPVTDEVCLHLMGEPLGHPEFKGIIDAATDLRVPVNLTTNGLLLSGERVELALSPIVRQVNVSVQSYADNFPGQDARPYMARVFRFARRCLAERPDLYLNLRLWDLSDDRAAAPENAMVRALIEAEFGVAFAALRVDPRRKKGYNLTGRINAHFDSRFEWPSPASPTRSDRGTCYGLKSHIGIHADGTVVPCCLDKEAVLALGNVQETPLTEILDAPRAKAMRAGFAAHTLVEDLCRRCTFVSRFDRKLKAPSAPRASGRSV